MYVLFQSCLGSVFNSIFAGFGSNTSTHFKRVAIFINERYEFPLTVVEITRKSLFSWFFEHIFEAISIHCAELFLCKTDVSSGVPGRNMPKRVQADDETQIRYGSSKRKHKDHPATAMGKDSWHVRRWSERASSVDHKSLTHLLSCVWRQFSCPKHIKIRFDNIIMHSQKQTSDQFGMHGMVFKLSTASEIKPDWTLEGFCKIARMEDPDAPYSFFPLFSKFTTPSALFSLLGHSCFEL